MSRCKFSSSSNNETTFFKVGNITQDRFIKKLGGPRAICPFKMVWCSCSCHFVHPSMFSLSSPYSTHNWNFCLMSQVLVDIVNVSKFRNYFNPNGTFDMSWDTIDLYPTSQPFDKDLTHGKWGIATQVIHCISRKSNLHCSIYIPDVHLGRQPFLLVKPLNQSSSRVPCANKRPKPIP